MIIPDSELNIIGDIGGRYEELLLLLKKMPQQAKLVCVGDLVDRGPESKRVVEHVMEHGISLRGNHEDMLLWVLKNAGVEHAAPKMNYFDGCWSNNGGIETLESYAGRSVRSRDSEDLIARFMPDKHIKWLNLLPDYVVATHEGSNRALWVTHAPVSPLHADLLAAWKFEDNLFEHGDTLTWSRNLPVERKGVFQVHGHNTLYGNPRWYVQEKDARIPGGIRRLVDFPSYVDDAWGVNIDTSRGRQLTGIHWPSMTIYQQEYIAE